MASLDDAGAGHLDEDRAPHRLAVIVGLAAGCRSGRPTAPQVVATPSAEHMEEDVRDRQRFIARAVADVRMTGPLAVENPDAAGADHVEAVGRDDDRRV